MEQGLLELIIIILLCTFQSIFGVGLLLFGTPFFLMIGYDFSSTLIIILPVSILISFFQIIYKNYLNKKLIVEYNLCTIPFVLIFLIFSVYTNYFDIKIFVSILLIVSSLLIIMKEKVISFKKYISTYRKYILMFIGSIHGLTNMGGGFLSIFSSIINEEDKYLARSYIAYGYFIMGIVQFTLITLIQNDILSIFKWYYLLIPICTFFPCQKVFKIINNTLFIKIIYYLAFIYGCLSLIIILNK